MLNTIHCIICENKFLSHTLSGQIQPWNCPNCNHDTYERLQRDLNELFKLIGFAAVDRLASRANKILELSQMYWKKDDQPEIVQMF